MKLALLAALSFSLAISQGTQEPQKATYIEQYVGIMFDYPMDWKITKKTKDRAYFAIPVPGSTEPAELQVVHTDYHADKDLFQTVQLRINEQLHREVVRQWEQEVLKVPLLFTRINYQDKDGIARSTLTGLYYTRTAQKLLLRLDTRESDYDNVSFVFHQAMETLRMVDGQPPIADDPAVKLENSGKKPQPVAPPPKVLDSEEKHTGAVKPGGTADVEVSQRKLKLLYPEGWTLEKVEGNKVFLTNTEMSQAVVAQLFTTLDSDPAKKALYKASSASLDRYTKVDSREDREGVKNRAGAVISTTWRIGKSQSGDLATFYGVGEVGDYYFLITYEQANLATYKNDRRVIDALMSQLTLEPTP